MRQTPPGFSRKTKRCYGRIAPILLPMNSVNHNFPPGPAVIQTGKLPGVGTVNSVMIPEGVILPILLPVDSFLTGKSSKETLH